MKKSCLFDIVLLPESQSSLHCYSVLNDLFGEKKLCIQLELESYTFCLLVILKSVYFTISSQQAYICCAFLLYLQICCYYATFKHRSIASIQHKLQFAICKQLRFKINQSAHLYSLVRSLVFRWKKRWTLGYPYSAHRKLRSDCIDA